MMLLEYMSVGGRVTRIVPGGVCLIVHAAGASRMGREISIEEPIRGQMRIAFRRKHSIFASLLCGRECGHESEEVFFSGAFAKRIIDLIHLRFLVKRFFGPVLNGPVSRRPLRVLIFFLI